MIMLCIVIDIARDNRTTIIKETVTDPLKIIDILDVLETNGDYIGGCPCACASFRLGNGDGVVDCWKLDILYYYNSDMKKYMPNGFGFNFSTDEFSYIKNKIISRLDIK